MRLVDKRASVRQVCIKRVRSEGMDHGQSDQSVHRLQHACTLTYFGQRAETRSGLSNNTVKDLLRLLYCMSYRQR